MLRAGVGLPALMKLLGHVNPEMTMRYVESSGPICSGSSIWPDRNPGISRRNPRSATPSSLAAGLDGVIEAFRTAQHVLEMFRRTLSDGTSRPLPRSAVEPPHENRHRNPRAPDTRRTGRDWPRSRSRGGRYACGKEGHQLG